MLVNIIIGLTLSLIVAGLAYYKETLTIGGFIAANIVGTLIYIFGSYIVWSVLIFFFLSSNLIAKFSPKKQVKDKRGLIQVLANSVVSLFFSILYYYLTNIVFLIVAVVAVAASTADTWASELGVLSKGKTFSVLTFKEMDKGLSGAVSKLGLLGSLMGSFIVSILFSTLYFISFKFNSLLLIEFIAIITIAGFMGSILDSYLGVLFQAKYKDLTTGKIVDSCKDLKNYILVSGKKLISNNTVNFLMVLTISITTYLILII